MRVYLCPSGQGGMALYSYKLANALAAKGLETTLFVDDQYELDDLPAKFSKIRILSSKNVGTDSNQGRIARMASIIGAHFSNWHKFFSFVQRDEPEIVHIQLLFYLVDWHILGRLKRTNAKLVLTVHDVLPHKFYTKHFAWIELIILRYIYKMADKLIVHAEVNRQQLIEKFSIDENKVVVIPHGEYCLNGISHEMSENAARSALDLRDKQKVVLFFGYIRRVKGINVLLRAFDLAAERCPDIILVIAGSVIQGESFYESREIIKQMKYRKRVQCYIQYVKHNDIPKFFVAADIVVLPYLDFYSQSGVVHLAQGFGKVVIASNAGGLPEAIEDHKTGLIVPSGDVERLADAMIYLMENDGLRTRMGQRAKEIAMEKFSWDNIAEATIVKAYN